MSLKRWLFGFESQGKAGESLHFCTSAVNTTIPHAQQPRHTGSLPCIIIICPHFIVTGRFLFAYLARCWVPWGCWCLCYWLLAHIEYGCAVSPFEITGGSHHLATWSCCGNYFLSSDSYLRKTISWCNVATHVQVRITASEQQHQQTHLNSWFRCYSSNYWWSVGASQWFHVRRGFLTVSLTHAQWCLMQHCWVMQLSSHTETNMCSINCGGILCYNYFGFQWPA